MQKRLLLCLFLIASSAQAQTNSLVEDILIFEHFTNASCGPCAQQNPAMEAVMNSLPTKATSLKYHVSWPGIDPMYSFNTSDPMDRRAFYGVNGVPAVHLSNQPGMSPSQITPTMINNYYQSMSPAFKYNIQSQIVGDSLFIAGYAVRFRPINTTDLKLHLVLAENPVVYTNPPGSNGETNFPMVVRKMFPNAQGTALGNGSTVTTFSFGYLIPAELVRDNLQLVLFVQSEGTKVAYKGIKIGLNQGFSSQVVPVERPEINIWPMPSQGVLNIGLEAITGKFNLRLIDQLGRLVEQSVYMADETDGKVLQKDFSHLPKGLYLMQLEDASGITQKHVLFQ